MRAEFYFAVLVSLGGRVQADVSPTASAYRPRLQRLRGGAAAAAAPAVTTTAVVEFDPPHAVEADEFISRVGVSIDEGLSANRVRKLQALHGPNVLAAEKPVPLWKLVAAQFDDRLVQILLGVAVLSYVLARVEGEENGWVEPVVILSILVLNAIVGTWQEKSAQSALDALQKLQPENARCLRNGVWDHAMAAAELVPGDIIEIRVGDRVPADCRLFRLLTTTIATDEGSLTGESMTVGKTVAKVSADSRIQDKSCLAFAGTVVTNGRALAIVTATGGSSEIGKIQQGVQEAKQEEEKTPLAQKMDAFADRLTYAIGAICVAVWGINYKNFWQPAFADPWRGALYYAKVAVALGVAAIPEGLPAVITLCLSLGTRRMAARRVIVRKLPSVETLGCTTVICTDKTGTLTTNQMTVTSLLTLERGRRKEVDLVERQVTGISYDPDGSVVNLPPSVLGGRGLEQLAAVCTMCNDAEIGYADGQYTRVGEPTEAALKILVEKLGKPGTPPAASAKDAATHFTAIRAAEYDRLATLEFSRTRKSMSVLCKNVVNGRNILLVKGAPEGLLPRCREVRLADGSTVPMTDALRKRLRAQFEGMAKRPLRCLGLAVKENGLGALANVRDSENLGGAARILSDTSRFVDVERGLTFVGLVGIKDPARPEVADSIERCSAAGIRVIMITGDSAATARAIARDVNILEDEELVFEGSSFFDLDQETQDELLLTKNLVFCRAEPQDKQRLIKQLQGLGEVAAMTGDGVNDAPALQQAAIGIAMGITGSEVSKQAADMILADDNFATIVTAVEEGRAIYANMKSFINFLITCNIGEVAAVFMATLMGLPEVRSPIVPQTPTPLPKPASHCVLTASPHGFIDPEPTSETRLPLHPHRWHTLPKAHSTHMIPTHSTLARPISPPSSPFLALPRPSSPFLALPSPFHVTSAGARPSPSPVGQSRN